MPNSLSARVSAFALPKVTKERYSALNQNGRAGFVMANSASDARASELEIRRQLMETGAVDVMIAIGNATLYPVVF